MSPNFFVSLLKERGGKLKIDASREISHRLCENIAIPVLQDNSTIIHLHIVVVVVRGICC